LPTLPETVLQVALALLLILFTIDYFDALTARCEGPQRDGFCGLWGGHNPASDFWNYRSRETYLRVSLISNLILLAAIAAPFLLRSPPVAFTAMIGIVVVGYVALSWLGPSLL
jgi:hypothetical protein